ncbi:isocitrate lyase/PEP mutase family protein [Actinoplanes derwentensis]|uniref:Methylisocitrate lyase n=1 Tax=Actinoplanes derwentensis TaxID=113562 RepID=A0A1H2ASE0_9ACTN|nr:isocitrate lyase/PEP mutase family protein [Actinoplanes derwentensis]GID84356.1 putative 2-methylisocitrate lyase 2 [Actinoplanes derwentensis]SDT48722.1 methylisocitrate lyase [Actinoplanes derwentensis]
MHVSALRALLAADRVTHVPGVYDPVTAALAVRAGHRAVHLGGSAVSATLLGRPVPDAQIADRASTLAPALDGVPLLADAETGFAEPRQAVWTALAYSRAGVSGLQLNDRASTSGPHPRDRGSVSGTRLQDQPGVSGSRLQDRDGRRRLGKLIGIGQATATIAALAEQVPEMVVIARTCAFPELGLDETIVRCRAYAEAGADAVLPEGVDTVEDWARLRAALPGVPLVIDRSEAAPGKTVLPDADLALAGVRLVLHPVTALLAAVRAVSLTYRAIADTGSAEPVDRMPWAAITELTVQEETRDARPAPAPTSTPAPGPVPDFGNLQT